MPRQIEWSADHEQTLRELWSTHTASILGGILGKSKNAVIGKAARMGLTKGSSSSRPVHSRSRPARVRPPRVAALKPPVPEPVVYVPPVDGGLHILELRHHHCREVIGHGSDQLARYCGATRKSTATGFCEYHHSINYTPRVTKSS